MKTPQEAAERAVDIENGDLSCANYSLLVERVAEAIEDARYEGRRSIASATTDVVKALAGYASMEERPEADAAAWAAIKSLDLAINGKAD